MQSFIVGIHVFVIFLLVIVVLVQSGKGAEISASFGGSSQTVFGSSGGANFFTRLTAGLATTFMVTSLVLTILGGQSRRSVFDDVPATQTQQQNQSEDAAAPAATGGDTAPAADTQKKSAPQK